jgi:hypothetical protein
MMSNEHDFLRVSDMRETLHVAPSVAKAQGSVTATCRLILSARTRSTRAQPGAGALPDTEVASKATMSDVPATRVPTAPLVGDDDEPPQGRSVADSTQSSGQTLTRKLASVAVSGW